VTVPLADAAHHRRRLGGGSPETQEVTRDTEEVQSEIHDKVKRTGQVEGGTGEASREEVKDPVKDTGSHQRHRKSTTDNVNKALLLQFKALR